jgi:hypothetical protein
MLFCVSLCYSKSEYFEMYICCDLLKNNNKTSYFLSSNSFLCFISMRGVEKKEKNDKREEVMNPSVKKSKSKYNKYNLFYRLERSKCCTMLIG